MLKESKEVKSKGNVIYISYFHSVINVVLGFGVWVSLQIYRHHLNFPSFPLPYQSPGGQTEKSLMFASMRNILQQQQGSVKPQQKDNDFIFIIFFSRASNPTPDSTSNGIDFAVFNLPSSCCSLYTIFEQKEKSNSIAYSQLSVHSCNLPISATQQLSSLYKA